MKLCCKDKKTIWTVSTMSCLWKLIQFSVIMWDSKNGTKMSIKICSQMDVYVYASINHKKNQRPLRQCNSTAQHSPVRAIHTDH